MQRRKRIASPLEAQQQGLTGRSPAPSPKRQLGSRGCSPVTSPKQARNGLSRFHQTDASDTPDATEADTDIAMETDFTAQETGMVLASGSVSEPGSPNGSPNTSPMTNLARRMNVKRPRDFPEEFTIASKIEEFEKRVECLALDEATLRKFDAATQASRKLHRSSTGPVTTTTLTDPDDWWGTQSAPSDGDGGEVMCEYFDIGSVAGKSRASSVCSLGSIYSRSSSRSSRSLRSARSVLSQSSLYHCSNDSQCSMYSDGSLYS